MKNDTFTSFRCCITSLKCQVCPRHGKCLMIKDQMVEIPKTLALDVINMMAREEPKPLKLHADRYYRCPSCSGLVSSASNYCSVCGQKIDWERYDNGIY